MWFFAVAFLAPGGITVPWSDYFVMFGPMAVFALAALTGFAVVKCKGGSISWFHVVAPLGVLSGIYTMTWYVLRLRWHLVFH